MSRWWLLIFILVAIIIAPFLIWGEWFDTIGFVGVKAWLENQGPWAWAAGVMLLCADIVLPIPGTIVMSALGFLYGPFLGGVIATSGSVLSGLIAYTACRFAGHGAAEWIAGRDALAKGEEWFHSGSAGWLVAVSRWTPVLPEAIACLAGIARMPFGFFFTALVCGTLPLGFAFAAIGHLGASRHETLAIALSAILPLMLYGLVVKVMLKRKGPSA